MQPALAPQPDHRYFLLAYLHAELELVRKATENAQSGPKEAFESAADMLSPAPKL